jgi:hypothetical protein
MSRKLGEKAGELILAGAGVLAEGLSGRDLAVGGGNLLQQGIGGAGGLDGLVGLLLRLGDERRCTLEGKGDVVGGGEHAGTQRRVGRRGGKLLQRAEKGIDGGTDRARVGIGECGLHCAERTGDGVAEALLRGRGIDAEVEHVVAQALNGFDIDPGVAPPRFKSFLT